jgi:2,3-bisphosphoglycerate-independent phosphoglycerate mutase
MKSYVLLILDGFGLSDNTKGNAVKLADTPNIDFLFKNYPWTTLNASGTYVGLPEGQMGNSEVGHLNIGAGRIVYQDLVKINKSIANKSFLYNKVLLQAINNSKLNKIKNNRDNCCLHVIGLVSDGGVHSTISHLYALLKLAKKNNIDQVYIHAFLDGRDTSPTSGINYLRELEDKIKHIGIGKIASVMGRYYAMDRDNHWDRIEKAYDAMVGVSDNLIDNVFDYLLESYKNGITDEFILPATVVQDGVIKENDSVIFFNFRSDRAREMTKAFCDKDFEKFIRNYLNTTFVCFTNYDVNIQNKLVAYNDENVKNTLGEYISNLGLKQLRIAETEKYAHVTFFLNGGIEQANKNEDRILIPSPRVATYDLKPEMSAFEVTEQLIAHVKDYDLTIANLANADMVGHTGNLSAAILAIEALDKCVGIVYNFILKNHIGLLICADHGNSEKMLDDSEQVFTAHTNNPVPLMLINFALDKNIKVKRGSLCDIAPTLLKLMGIKKPIEMTGMSLV